MKRTTFLFTVLLIAVTAFASENEPPVTPRAPIPEDNSSVLTAKKILSWECFDPDFDALTYDVYFGTSAYPPLVKKDHETSSYSLGGLQKNETYYWRVVAKDTEGHSVSGPIWRFTTNTFELGISFGIGIPRGFPLPGVKIEIGDFSIGLGYMGDLFIPLEWRFIPFGRGKSGYFYVVPGFDIIIKWGGGNLKGFLFHGMLGYRWNISEALFIDIAGGVISDLKKIIPAVNLAIGWTWGL